MGVGYFQRISGRPISAQFDAFGLRSIRVAQRGSAGVRGKKREIRVLFSGHFLHGWRSFQGTAVSIETTAGIDHEASLRTHCAPVNSDSSDEWSGESLVASEFIHAKNGPQAVFSMPDQATGISSDTDMN
jgi:hypothetical protein